MNRGEVRALARFFINDQAGTIVSDPDFNALLAVAVEKVVTEIRTLDEDYLLKTAPLNTTSNTRDYPFSTIASDVDRIRMIEKVQSPSYPKLTKMDWLKHKHEFTATGEPKYWTVINGKVVLLKVPNNVYNYTAYYDPIVIQPAKDTDPIPLIPAKFHDLVAIWAAVMARGALSGYSKRLEETSHVVDLLGERKRDLAMDLSGARSEEVEVRPGVLGKEAQGG